MAIRKLFLFALVLMMGLQAKAQTVTVDNVYAVPGKTGEFTVCLSGGKTDKYTAMTLNAQFPKTGFTPVETYEVKSSAWKQAWLDNEKTQTGTLGVFGAVDANGLAIIPFASSEALAGGTKEQLVTVRFNVADNVAPGEYNITLKGTEFGYDITGKDIAEDVTFKVKVVQNGDVNADNAVDTQDAIKVIQYFLKKNPSNFIKIAGDITGEGDIDTQDAIRIIKIFLKK